MVVIRPTRKLHSAIPPTVGRGPSDTALGDWYVNRLVVDRRPLLLLVSSTSLLPILVPARDVRGLPGRLAALVASRVRRMGTGSHIIDHELQAMAEVVVGPTVDRSVVGIMVDFAKGIPSYLEPGQWDEDTLPMVEDRLAETPCYAGRSFEQVVFPDKAAPERLTAMWLANRPLQPTSVERIRIH